MLCTHDMLTELHRYCSALNTYWTGRLCGREGRTTLAFTKCILYNLVQLTLPSVHTPHICMTYGNVTLKPPGFTTWSFKV